MVPDFLHGFRQAYEYQERAGYFELYKAVNLTMTSLSMLVVGYSVNVALKHSASLTKGHRTTVLANMILPYIASIALSLVEFGGVLPYPVGFILWPVRISRYATTAGLGVICGLTALRMLSSLVAFSLNIASCMPPRKRRRDYQCRIITTFLSFTIVASILAPTWLYFTFLDENSLHLYAHVETDPDIGHLFGHLNAIVYPLYSVGGKIIRYVIVAAMPIAIIGALSLRFLVLRWFGGYASRNLLSASLIQQHKHVLDMTAFYAGITILCDMLPLLYVILIVYSRWMWISRYPALLLWFIPVQCEAPIICIFYLLKMRSYRSAVKKTIVPFKNVLF